MSESIALALHPRNDVSEVAGQILAWAREHGLDVVVRDSDRARVPGAQPVSDTEFGQDCLGVVSLGGDGTMLGALRLVADHPVPVLGVHLGNLGFLVEVRPHELGAALDRLVARDYTIEPHAALRVRLDEQELIAFNDLALVRQPGHGSADASLAVDGLEYGYYRCDALVIATAAGSSAYSYAAGGPLVSPSVDALVVTPSAPMSGISRPVVLSAGDQVELRMNPRCGELVAECDGLVSGTVGPGDTLTIRTQPGAGQVVRLDPQGHQRRSRVKLSLLDLPLLPEQMRELLPPDLRKRLDEHNQDPKGNPIPRL